MRDAQDAEDAVQEAYLRAYRSIATFRGDSPRAWMLAIVRNACYTALEAKHRLGTETVPLGVVDADGSAEEAAQLWDPDQRNPESALLRKREDQDIRRMVEALPIAFREALILREMGDLSYREIAEATATPIGTVMSRLARARRLLQRAWMRREEEEPGQ